MATVPDLSGNSPLDKTLVKYNREVAGNPNETGPLTPEFSGEIVHDTTNDMLWQAQDTSSNSWVAKSDATQDVVT